MLNCGNCLMSMTIDCHCSQSSGSSGSSHTTCFSKRVCIRNLKRMVTGAASPTGSNTFDESWRTSRLVITVDKVVFLSMSDSLSVSVCQWTPRTLAGTVESVVFSLHVIKLSCELFDTHDLKLNLASDIMTLACL